MISIGELEGVLDRLFSPTVANDEKQNIENGLGKIRENPESVDFACQILNESQHQYAVWFACLTLERVAQTQWTNVPNRDDVRSFVLRYALRQHGGGLPKHVVVKLAKVVVEMAKHDWPERYPSFLQDILSACAQPDEATSTAGLQILLLTIEEFALDSSKAVITSARKNELRSMLRQEVGNIMKLVASTMNQGLSSPEVNAGRESTKVTLSFQILQQVFAWLQVSQVVSVEVMEAVFKYMSLLHSEHAVQALMCINEMLDKNLVPKEVVDFILRVSVAALETLQKLSGGQDNSVLENCAAGVVSQYTRFLSILLRKHLRRLESVPNFSVVSFAELLATYTLRQENTDDFLYALELWSVYTKYVSDEHERGSQSQAASAYLQVLCQLMMKLVERALWSTNEEGLQNIDDEPPERASSPRLGDAGRMSSSSSLLNRSSEDDDQEEEYDTEYERYIARIATLVSQIGVLPVPYEGPAFEPLLMEAGRHLQSNMEVLSSFFRQLSQGQTSSSVDIERYAHAAADIATLMQIASQLAHWLVVPGRFSTLFDAALQYMRWSMELIEAVNNHRLYTYGPSFVRLQVRALELATSMCTWLQKLGQLAQAVLSTSGEVSDGDKQVLQNNSTARDFISNFDNVAMQVIDHALSSLSSNMSPVPEEISIAAIDLFAAICANVIPTRLVEYSSMQRVCGNLAEFSAPLAIRARSRLYVAVSKMTLSPAAKRVASGEREKTKATYTDRIGPITQTLTTLVEQCAQNQNAGTPSSRAQHTERCRPLLSILVAISEDSVNEGTTTKQIISSVVLPALPVTVRFINILMQPAVDLGMHGNQLSQDQANRLRRQVTLSLGAARDALDFVVAALNAFSRQAGKDACLQTVSDLVDIFTRQSLAHNVAENGSGGPLLLLKLLRLFVALLNDPSTNFYPVFPKLLTLCLQEFPEITSKLAARSSAENSTGSAAAAEHAIDLFEVQYELIHTVLRQHWRWFWRDDRNDPNHMYFTRSMELLLESLEMQSLAPTTFRHNLAIFDDLQNTHKLFQVEHFKDNMRPAFLQTLLYVLVSKSRELLQEEILVTLYGLASVDLDGFFDQIVPNFIRFYVNKVHQSQPNDLTAREAMKALANRPRDMPSFIIALRAFANDVRVLL